jgi:hypothetical protein
VRATNLTNDLINALDQMMKNSNLDAENHLEIFSDDFSADDDQADEEISQQPQESRRSERERKASKLAERIIQYDPRKKMPRANVITEDKSAHKKSILECYMHMIKILIMLINSDDQSNSSDQSDEPQILNEATQRSD